MEPIEVTGRTEEEAVQLAATELGVSVEAVDYEVIEEGTKGFLGLGQLPCVIKAKIKEGYEPSAELAPSAAEVSFEEAVEEQKYGVAPQGEVSFDEALQKILTDVISAMGLQVQPVIRESSDDEINVDLQGAEAGMLIGHQGSTLDALQYLVSIAASKASGDKKRVILDAEGFRDRHRYLLEKVARECAQAVKEQGQEAELEPQSARDRRIIHMALADDPDVYTYSEGEGENRHVVISPKK